MSIETPITHMAMIADEVTVDDDPRPKMNIKTQEDIDLYIQKLRDSGVVILSTKPAEARISIRLDSDGKPIEKSFFDVMDLSNAPRDPETGEIIIKEKKAHQGGAASRMKAMGYEVSQEDLDFFG